jgi:hypothetical protein
MDAVLNHRWQTAQTPFSGNCLIGDGTLTVDELRELLLVVTSRLRMRGEGVELFSFDDWHHHDGFVTQRRVTEWTAIETACASRESLIGFRQGDTSVHRAFYPADFEFLLRFDVGDDEIGDGTGHCGSIDICADSETLDEIYSLVSPEMRSKLQVTEAKPYFDRTYAG